MPVPENYNPRDTKAESKHLRAEDYDLDQKWRLTIEDVDLTLMPARDNKPARNRLVLFFAGREKGLVLNATNQGFMEARLGEQPNNWIGAVVVLHRTTTVYGEKTVPAFRLIEAKKPTGAAKPKPAPKPVEPVYEVEPIDEGAAAQYDTDDTPF
jgi:hypothetical protein